MNPRQRIGQPSQMTRRDLIKRGAALGLAIPAATELRSTAAAQATPEPQRGGSLVIAQGTDVATFDAMLLSGLPSFGIVAQVTEQLVRLGPDGTLRARLAESWTQSEDGETWTLNLVQGATFHDGTPFNAEAVRTQIERFLEISPGRQSLAAVASVEPVDETTVNIVTNGPYAPLMYALSYAPIQMNSPTAVAEAGDAYGSPAVGAVGTGAFTFGSHEPSVEVQLQAYADYWNGTPYLDSVIMRPIPETGSRIIALESGDADFVFEVPPLEAQRLEEETDFRVIRQPSERIPYLTMNNSWGPFQDRRVRQAVFYAIDRQALVDEILLGTAQVAQSPVPSLAFGSAPVLDYGYDPAESMQLLADAGFEDGFDVTFTYPPGRFTNDTEIVGAIQLYLRAVGIRANIVQMEFAAWQAESRRPREENQLQLTIQSRGATTLDADKALSDFTTAAWPPNGLNLSFYENEEVDRMVQEQRTMIDTDARLDLLRQIQEIIAEDVPDVYLYEIQQIFGANPAVHGVEVDPTQVLLPLDRAWVAR